MKDWNTFEKFGAIVAVLIILGGIAWYASKDIGSSSASTLPPTKLVVSLDATSPLSDLVIGGTSDHKESVWKFGVEQGSTAQSDVYVAGVTYTIHTDVLSAIEGGSLWTSGGQRLASVPAVLSGGRLILPFVFEEPIIVSIEEVTKLELRTDIGRVGGTSLVNDTRYDIAIDEPEDILLILGLPQRVNVELNRENLPLYNYVFKTRPYFSLNSSSPFGNLVAGPNTTVAIFNVTADATGDVTFTKNAVPEGNGFISRAEYKASDLEEARVDIELWNQNESVSIAKKSVGYQGLEGKIAAEFQIGLPSNEGISELTVPAGQTRHLVVKMDTTEFEDSGDWMRWYMHPYESEIKWSVEGDRGDYRHGDIILGFEKLYAHKLTNL